ncbi:MAG: TonB-dependent receptor [Proteobacteria bacterium]|nr:TonB-dependent receptor [Pseudomonadota bacterium]
MKLRDKCAGAMRISRFGAGSVSLLALAAMMPQVAWAQDAAPAADAGADGQEIVVSGIRYSIANSLNIKKRESSIVEAVSAEEIGKLPDVSIAESIARLPGLAAQRTGGRANIISVRGFSPDFSTVLLNGRQQASSGYNRAVEFDQYPSELMSSVVVYKSPDADVSGMGLAGTVDLRSIRPLAYGKRAIAINVRGQMDEGGDRNKDFSKWGGRGSISYVDQNADGTLGWAIGYAYLDAGTHTNHTKNWFYDNYGGSTYLLSGQEALANSSRDRRHGVMGTLEWKPSDSVHSTLDLYYSRFKQKTISRGAMWFSDQWADSGTFSNTTATTIGGNSFGAAGHFQNAVPILRNDYNTRKDELFSAGWNGEFKFDEKTALTADLSYSSNKRDESYIETYAGYGAGAYQTRVMDSYDYTVSQNGFPQFTGFGLNYADASKVALGDKAPWGGWGHDGLFKSPHIKETLYAGDLGLSRELGGFFSKIDLGVNYTHRKKTKSVEELDLFLKNSRAQIPIGSQFLINPTSLDFAGSLSTIAFNVPGALGTYYDQVQLLDSNHYDKSWGIKEDIITGRAKLTIEHGNLHGNIGLQVVHQKQNSTGLRINPLVSPIALASVDVSDSYTDWLPSLNLFVDVNGGHRFRLAVAKVMARPRMDDMRANMTPNFDSNICAGGAVCTAGQTVHPWSATGGNPNLKPWRATEANVAWEWYGGKATYFSVNAFYMQLDNYIYTQLLPADFSGFTPPASASNIPAGVIVSNTGTLSAPANGPGGWVDGVEVSGAFEFGKISSALDGFGMSGSVAYSGYKLRKAASATVGILPGFSDWVYNVTGYYEKNGFQARASYRYRSAFKGEVVSLWTNLGTPMILADKQLDAQIGYSFPEGSSLGGLGVQLQVNNVLDSPYRTSYAVNGTQVLETYEKYGRQWLLGVSYKY